MIARCSNLTNYHSHCDFCDGHAPMEAFVQEAIRQGFVAYGFTSHAPFLVENNCNMKRENLSVYLAEFRRLKALYAKQIELYVGLEIDFLNADFYPGIDYFRNLPLDYRIGSVHYIVAPDGTPVDTDGSPERFKGYVDTYFGGDVDEVVRRFYQSSRQMLEWGGFDILGHFDKIGLNASCYRPGLDNEPWYKALVSDYIDEIARRGVLVEVNTKAWERQGRLFPHTDYLRMMRKAGIRVVVNSDAHYPEKINWGREAAFRALLQAGYTTVWQLMQGGWREVAIEP